MFNISTIALDWRVQIVLHVYTQIADLFVEHVQSAINVCIEEVLEKLKVRNACFYSLENKDFLDSLHDAKMVRILVDMWVGNKKGKSLLLQLKTIVNQTYKEHIFWGGDVQDLIVEINNFLQHYEQIERRDACLRVLKSTIDNQTSTHGGDGFVKIIIRYLTTNHLIHQTLTTKKFIMIKEKKLHQGKNFI